MSKDNQNARTPSAKKILDKYATAILRQSAIFERNGVSIPNLDKVEDYTPESYKGDEVLWIPPKDCIRIEFEHDDTKTNIRCIRECESAAKALGFDYCITEHEGGKSPYFNMFNIKRMPVNEDGPIAKSLLIDLILPEAVKARLDRSNLGWTYSPIIGHPHWKKKYKGAVHKNIRGINPLEQQNEYSENLLKQIKKSKVHYKSNVFQVQQQYSWVADFLINYCTKNRLPTGTRNHIIEKNLAVLIIHNRNRDKLIAEYLVVQGRKHNSVKGWLTKVAKGEITQVSPMELKRYIEDNNIPYEIPTDKEGIKKKEKKPTTPEEHKILSDPKLLDIIIREIQEKRVVGEKETIECIIIVTNCRLVKNIKATSSNINVNDESGLGKDWIVKGVLDILPDNVVVYRTKITPELLTYWHNSKYEPEWTWDGKILYIEDISTTLLNSDVFKVFSSGGSKATVLIKQLPIDIIINGKPSMVITSYQVNPNSENLRRYPICFCDSSEDQTLEIMRRQSYEDATGYIYSYNPELKAAISKLRMVSVVIPFAEKLPYFFPKNNFMRTHYKRFLDYIKSSAALHQYQREEDGHGNIVATGEDYDIARMVLLKNTNNPSMIPLTRDQDNIFNFFKEHPDQWYSVNDIENKFPISSEWLRKQLKQLFKNGFLNSIQAEREGVKRKVTEYSFSSENTVEIPLYSRIIDDSSVNTINTINTINPSNTINNNLPSIKTPNVYIPKDKITTELTDIQQKNKKITTELTDKPQEGLSRNGVSTGEKKLLNELNELNEHGLNKQQKISLNTKIQELKKYCEDLKAKGHKLTYDNLCFNFDVDFIEKCKQDRLLKALPEGDYYI